MSQERFGYNEKIPEPLREITMKLCEDVVMLQHKWSFYLELFSTSENQAIVFGMIHSFAQAVEESFRQDMTMTICRLSDPPHQHHSENLSMGILVEKCPEITWLDELMTEFVAACDPVRRVRNKLVGHSDLATIVAPHNNPLPGIGRSQVESILTLARRILRTVYGHYANTDLSFDLIHRGGAKELIHFLKLARERLDQRWHERHQAG